MRQESYLPPVGRMSATKMTTPGGMLRPTLKQIERKWPTLNSRRSTTVDIWPTAAWITRKHTDVICIPYQVSRIVLYHTPHSCSLFSPITKCCVDSIWMFILQSHSTFIHPSRPKSSSERERVRLRVSYSVYVYLYYGFFKRQRRRPSGWHGYEPSGPPARLRSTC